MKSSERESFDNAALSVRFTGPRLSEQGVAIYDLAQTLMALQRMMNKAHLVTENRLKKGGYPSREERGKISLQLGERRRESDAFALVPIFTDFQTLNYLKSLAEMLTSALVGYAVGKVLDGFNEQGNKEDGDKFSVLVGSIHADVVNIVGRIDAPGGVKQVHIKGPPNDKSEPIIFDSRSKRYVDGLSGRYVLGRPQSISGKVYRMYPSTEIVTIRRAEGNRVDIYLGSKDFNAIRYSRKDNPTIAFFGRPRYKFGAETMVVTEFEADSIIFENDG